MNALEAHVRATREVENAIRRLSRRKAPEISAASVVVEVQRKKQLDESEVQNLKQLAAEALRRRWG